MSYHNLPLHNPNIPNDVVSSCMRQHVVLVDMLMQNEIKQNGWFPHAVPFYPESEQNEDKNVKKKEKHEEKEQEREPVELKEPDEKENVKEMPFWISKGKHLKKYYFK